MHIRLSFCVSVFVVAGLWVLPARSGVERKRPVALLAALDSELTTLKREVEVVGRPLNFGGRSVWQARFRGVPVLLARTGADPGAADELARWLTTGYGVKALISIGPSGALNSELEIGDMVIAMEAVDSRSRVIGSLYTPGSDHCSLKRVDRILTMNRFVATAAERDELRRIHGSDVVDMSAAPVARAAADAGIPCVIIREITDRADEEAPRAFVEVVGEKQPRTIPAALCALEEITSGDPAVTRRQGASNESR